MNAFFHVVALAALSILLTSCGSTSIVPVADFITYGDNGETVVVQNGGAIHLDLASIGDDHRTWFIDEKIPDILLQVKEPNYRAFKNDYLEGETVVWEFQAIKTGAANLKLAYRGDKETEAAKTFNVTIVVQDAVNIFVSKKKRKESKQEKKARKQAADEVKAERKARDKGLSKSYKTTTKVSNTDGKSKEKSKWISPRRRK